MKDKIMIFVIGLLIGAIITASGFLIYEKTNKKNNDQMPMGGMQMMERPDENNTPPEMPNGMGEDNNRPEPPSKNDTSINKETGRKGENNEEKNNI